MTLRLLLELLRGAPYVVEKGYLLDTLWEGAPSSWSLTSAMGRLRKVLGDEGQKRIVTVRKLGYRFDGPLSKTSGEDAPPSERPPDAPDAGPSSAEVVVELLHDLVQSAELSTLDARQSSSIVEVLQRTRDRWSERFKDDPRAEARMRMEIGLAFHHMADYAEGAQETLRALTRLAPVVPPDDPLLLVVRFTLVSQLATASQLAEARKQLDLAEDSMNLSPPVQGLSGVTLAANTARFTYLFMCNRFGEALAPGRLMVALSEAGGQKDLRIRFSACFRLADLEYRLNHFAEAEHLLGPILAPPFSPETVGEAFYARGRIQLARVRVATGNIDGTEASLIEARDVLIGRFGEDEYYAAVANIELANIYGARADFAKATEALKAAYASFVATYDETHQSARIAALNLAINQLNAGDAGEALATLERERSQFVIELGGVDNAVVQSIDFQRARAMSTLHRPGDALALLDRLNHERLAEAEPGRDWQWRLQAERGRALLAVDRAMEGTSLLRTAIKHMEALHASAWIVASYRRLLPGPD